jgi:hypothetical protein
MEQLKDIGCPGAAVVIVIVIAAACVLVAYIRGIVGK